MERFHDIQRQITDLERQYNDRLCKLTQEFDTLTYEANMLDCELNHSPYDHKKAQVLNGKNKAIDNLEYNIDVAVPTERDAKHMALIKKQLDVLGEIVGYDVRTSVNHILRYASGFYPVGYGGDPRIVDLDMM